MSTPLLVVVSIVGYLLVGAVVGAIMGIGVYRDSGNKTDAQAISVATCICWPLATLVAIFGAVWIYLIHPLTLPKSVKQAIEANYQQRKDQAIAQGIDPKTVPKRYQPTYED